MGVAEAIIASALIGAGSSAYAADEQKRAMEEAERARQRAAAEAEAERQRIAANTRPEEESAGEGIEFGLFDDETGTTQDFLVDRTSNTSQLGTAGGSGLGFDI